MGYTRSGTRVTLSIPAAARSPADAQIQQPCGGSLELPAPFARRSVIPTRPIYHWKSFWLGLLVLSFIGWAWQDSTRSWTYIRCRQFVLTHAGAGASLAVWGPGGEYHAIPLWHRQKLSDSYNYWKQAGFEAPATFLCTGSPYERPVSWPAMFPKLRIGPLLARFVQPCDRYTHCLHPSLDAHADLPPPVDRLPCVELAALYRRSQSLKFESAGPLASQKHAQLSRFPVPTHTGKEESAASIALGDGAGRWAAPRIADLSEQPVLQIESASRSMGSVPAS